MDRRDRQLLNTQMSRFFLSAPRRDGVLILATVGVFIAGLAAGGLLFTFGSNPSAPTAFKRREDSFSFLFERDRNYHTAIAPGGGHEPQADQLI